MRIEVTQADIRRGRRFSECGCPVARATRRATKWRKPVFVGDGEIAVGDQAWGMPRAVSRFVSAFDEGEPVKPFTFTLRDRK